MHIFIQDNNKARAAAIMAYLTRLRPQWTITASPQAPLLSSVMDVVLGVEPSASICSPYICCGGLSGRAILQRVENMMARSTVPTTQYARFESLSLRERQVLDYLRQGAVNKEIAHALGLHIATVKLHVRSMCKKLGVKNRLQAALLAQRFSTH